MSRYRIGRSFCWSSRNRPYLLTWRDGDGWGLFIEWGNRNSDPLWSIGVERKASR